MWRGVALQIFVKEGGEACRDLKLRKGVQPLWGRALVAGGESGLGGRLALNGRWRCHPLQEKEEQGNLQTF
ncbi:hypothetical protein TIFTF001_004215 [Ficus carica]|uniref:Uncharacterized protein n=1 Tax=Ficus carica TaxID=3494 RepID=A0AA87ZIH0_FICCA|nr:hypothetical protein TIFTF001_004215 [Ficus carica]